MKRSFISLGLIVAATFALTNCTKDIENPSDKPETAGIPFEIIASTADTKTTNDGEYTNWAAGDAINLFHAAAATTDYTNDKKFSVADTETGRFTGTLASALTASAYDWYALYPYNSDIKTPGEQTSGFTYIGNKTGLTQKGYNNMEHISGTNCPLYGVSKNVSSTDSPTIDMYHLSSVLKVNVKNGIDAPLIVDEVSFTAGDEELVGSFYINIAGADVEYKASSVNYVNTKATVTVSNGIELAKGETAIVYLVVKPFTASAGDVLSLIVNGAVKEITLPSDVKFEAGHVKTLNYEYTQAASATKVNVKEFIDAVKSDTELYEVTGTIVSIDEISAYYNNATINIADDNGNEVKIYRMNPADGGLAIDKIGLSLGDQLTVQGYRSDYNGSPQMKQGGVYVSHEDACEPPVIKCDNNKVSISCPTDGAKLYYTTGTEYTEYTEPIDITQDETVKAYATADGMLKSLVVSADCKFNDPNAGSKYYVKVTSAPADWSGEYLIVFADNKAHSIVASNNKDLVSSSGTVLTIENNKILSDDTSDKDAVVISTKGDGYKIKLSSGKYLTVPSSNAVGNNTEANASELKLEWTSTGVKISGVDSAGKTRYLCNNSTYYRMYTSVGSYKLPTLYKLED